LKVKKADVYITISSSKTIIRTRDLPVVKKKEMDNIIRFEADQFLPYSSEAFSIDYKIVGSYTDEDGGVLAKVMIVAVPKELVDDFMTLINLTKLTLKGMTVYTDAVYSYFTQFNENKGKNVLIADIGHNSTRMLMLESNQYFANISNDKAYNEVYRRIIESGKVRGEKVTDLLAGKHGVNSEQENLNDEKETQVSDTTESKLAGLSNRMNAIKKNNSISNEEKVNDLRNRLNLMKNKANSVSVDISKEEKSLEAEEKPDVDKIMARIMNTHAPQNSESEQVETNYEKVLDNAYYEVVREILRMVDFFKTRKYNTFVDEIMLIGGGTNMHRFEEYVFTSTDIKTTTITSNDKIGTNDDFSSLIPAIGAILGG